jgi:MraZ protein
LNSEVRQFQRAVMKASDEVEMDQQGRIVISPVLRKEANLAKNVVIVGLLNRVEIWDKQKVRKLPRADVAEVAGADGPETF